MYALVHVDMYVALFMQTNVIKKDSIIGIDRWREIPLFGKKGLIMSLPSGMDIPCSGFFPPSPSFFNRLIG